MADRAPDSSPWTRHVVYKTEHLRTTWTFRLSVVALLTLVLWLTRDAWIVAIDRSLACDRSTTRSEAIVVDNFTVEYLLFERATKLRRAGAADRVVVPVSTAPDSDQPEPVTTAVVKLMANLAGVGDIEIVPIREVEPISLNAARDLLRFVQRQGIRSVILVSPHIRSRRSMLIYQDILGGAGIAVRCEPVKGRQARWTDTWHGIENVVEQWLKLQYYRVIVLPFRHRG
jgi:hypothetical protein